MSAAVTSDELSRLALECVEAADYYASIAGRNGGAAGAIEASKLYLAAEALQRRANVLRDVEAVTSAAAV